MTKEEILEANTSDEVTKTMDDIQSIIEGGEGVSQASDVLENLRRVRRGYFINPFSRKSGREAVTALRRGVRSRNKHGGSYLSRRVFVPG